jgi:hypothetical protein
VRMPDRDVSEVADRKSNPLLYSHFQGGARVLLQCCKSRSLTKALLVYYDQMPPSMRIGGVKEIRPMCSWTWVFRTEGSADF